MHNCPEIFLKIQKKKLNMNHIKVDTTTNNFYFKLYMHISTVWLVLYTVLRSAIPP